ncbi:UNVERIFIED_CONTAM: Sm-like protein LSM7 [Sesamum calycinum]|uniref:Sm-like protein LSM7 n=1 Tax=Sesamum calycinum TaxID=2727403 RepID=A0AAW2MB46_9LAMI
MAEEIARTTLKELRKKMLNWFSFQEKLTGTLKGYDPLLNLVLDEAIEFLRDPDDPLKTTDQTRPLGLICPVLFKVCGSLRNLTLVPSVCRGIAVMLVSPAEGTVEIPNPFVQPDRA